MPAFERIIRSLPKELKVLDVGCGGLLGENTSQYLQAYFLDALGVNIKENKDLVEFKRIYPNAKVVIDDYKNIKDKFDLVVLDLNIEGNLENWSVEGLKNLRGIVKDGGYLLNYIMMTDQYGDSETTELLRQHCGKWWKAFTREAIGKKLKQLKGWRLQACEQEERRNYILWVLLKKTNG